jgi:hypothetical protein
MVADIHDNVQPQAAMCRDGFVQRAIQDGNKRFQIRSFTSGAQPDPRLVTCGGHLHEPINAQVHPHTLKRILDHGGNAGLPGSRSTVQNHNLTGCIYLQHVPPLAANDIKLLIR